jgi:hypothetical protein
VTLLPGLIAPDVDALRTAAALAQGLRPIPLTLTAIEGRDEHFRCLFLRTEATPTLVEANAAASHAFGRSPDPAFLPHLSLVYGTLDAGRKAGLVRELAGLAGSTFLAQRLHLWRTDGPVADWREIGAFVMALSCPP